MSRREGCDVRRIRKDSLLGSGVDWLRIDIVPA